MEEMWISSTNPYRKSWKIWGVAVSYTVHAENMGSRNSSKKKNAVAISIATVCYG